MSVNLQPRSLIFVLIAFLLAGCAGEDKSGEFYTDWDISGGCLSGIVGDDRVDAGGRLVDVCDFVDADGWVWVTYAAGWCSASRNQAAEVRRFSAQAGAHGVEVFTVLTSGDETFSPARSSHAAAWASTHGLPAGRVLAEGTEGGGRIIPQHLLIGPDGRTWYRYVGYLDSEAMLALVDDFASGRRVPNVRAMPKKR